MTLKQEANANLETRSQKGDRSVDAAMFAALSELENIYTLKEEQRTALTPLTPIGSHALFPTSSAGGEETGLARFKCDHPITLHDLLLEGLV